MNPLFLESMGGYGSFFLGLYLVLHLPAIIMLIIGLVLLKKKPKTAKVLLIIAGVYFLIGGGICGALVGA